MKRNPLPVLAVAAALSALFATPAAAVTTQFSTSLSSLGEPFPTSTATGSALVTLDDVLKSVAVNVSFAGLAAAANNGHIHCCTAAAGLGSVAVALAFAGFPASQTDSYNNSFTLSAASFATLQAGIVAGKAYVNVHSVGLYSGGEIRGFLAPVPEPTSYALMLAGLCLVGVAARRGAKG